MEIAVEDYRLMAVLVPLLLGAAFAKRSYAAVMLAETY